MKYHFDATDDYLKRQNELEILLDAARETDSDEKEKLFLKLAVVSLVTKFQIYIESILKEFVYQLKIKQVKYGSLPIYMQLNSIKLKSSDNALIKLSNHAKFTEETKRKIKEYLVTVSDVIEGEETVNDSLNFRMSYPLGKTGKKELLDLFKQIEGKNNIFASEETGEELIDLNILDSLLLTRHLIVHQDRFNETEVKIVEYKAYVLDVVFYCDAYLEKCLNSFGVIMEERNYEGM